LIESPDTSQWDRLSLGVGPDSYRFTTSELGTSFIDFCSDPSTAHLVTGNTSGEQAYPRRHACGRVGPAGAPHGFSTGPLLETAARRLSHAARQRRTCHSQRWCVWPNGHAEGLAADEPGTRISCGRTPPDGALGGRARSRRRTGGTPRALAVISDCSWVAIMPMNSTGMRWLLGVLCAPRVSRERGADAPVGTPTVQVLSCSLA
jgi:hypothetical protein